MMPPAGNFARLLLLPVAAGYLLHLLDESRLGLPFEWRYLTPTLLLLAIAGTGFALRRPLLALPAAGLGGFLVAYYGGLGHLLPVGSLYPLALTDGPGGWLVGLNSLLGLTLAVLAFASLSTWRRAGRLAAHEASEATIDT